MANKKSKKKFKLIPPRSGVEEYVSVYEKDLTFVLKVFDFDEEDTYVSMILKHMEFDKDGNIIKDENDQPKIKGDDYFVDVFELGVVEIKGLETEEYEPSWRVIKEIVNKISELNSVKSRKK